MEEVIFAQLLIAIKTCYLKAHLGVTIPTPATAMLELFLTIWNQETALDLQIGHLLACKTQNHHLKLGEVCGEAISCAGTAAVEKPGACARCSAFLQLPITTFIMIFTVQQCWVERAHGCILPPLLSFQIPICKQFWNNFLQVMRLLPCCFTGTSHLGMCTKERSLVTLDLPAIL